MSRETAGDWALRTVNDQLAAKSGYVVPHGVMAHGVSHGRALVTMIGAATDTTLPGGMVEIDDKTGAFVEHFGPGPVRDPGESDPKYMYDFESLPGANRGISTTFGSPACVARGIEPGCLGNEVSVWDVRRQKVIQTADLGASSGALMVHFVMKKGVRRAFINAPGTSAIWLADDDDRDGVFDFQQVLGPDDGLAIPPDLICPNDSKYLYVSNWFGDTVQQFDISDPFDPVLTATVSVPHPNMLRLSRDNKRLYVTNSLLTPWDNDPDFGPARNDDYGIWLFRVDQRSGRLTPSRPGGKSLGRLHERQEEDNDRPGRAAHDALRPEHPDGARRALRKEARQDGPDRTGPYGWKRRRSTILSTVLRSARNASPTRSSSSAGTAATAARFASSCPVAKRSCV